ALSYLYSYSRDIASDYHLGNDLSAIYGQSNFYIVIKSMSDQVLISSEELMERFVQGDLSRNTEGSGLGLSIARSLVELQKGSINLHIDGDLFKVVLVFDRLHD
ncbi:MAG TPA: hypothetical protein DCM45_03310, partial [Clostridiales bacterium]|nr:hypothetical protein [Clostridiales bacterium]